MRVLLLVVLMGYLAVTMPANAASGYAGFSVARLINSFHTGITYTEKGLDDSDKQMWVAGFPPADAPYTYLYSGKADYELSSGISSSVEGGWYVPKKYFAGIELIYMNTDLNNEGSTPMDITFDVLSALVGGTALLFFSPAHKYGGYIGGAVGTARISISHNNYILESLVSSDNPVSGTTTPGAYISTIISPAGNIMNGHAVELAYKIRGGFVAELIDDSFLTIGATYYGMSDVNELTDLSRDKTRDGIVLLEDGTDLAPENVQATVTMYPATLRVSQFSFSNIGAEIGIRIGFADD